MATEEELTQMAHSPVHTAVARRDHAALADILNALPRGRLSRVRVGQAELLTGEELLEEEERAGAISAALDRRDVPNRETPLHVAVRLGDADCVEMLLSAGADWALPDAQGWHSLAHALSTANQGIAAAILRHAERLSWGRWCRALPRLLPLMDRAPDFYAEIDLHLEGPLFSLVSAIVPSDTCRIWKQGSNLRLDATFAGYDAALRLRRCHRSYVFLGRGSPDSPAPGSMLLLNHRDKQFATDFWCSDHQIAERVEQMEQMGVRSVGIDLSRAELLPDLNWRRHHKTETVGNWTAKMYEMRHVEVSLKYNAKAVAPDPLQSALRALRVSLSEDHHQNQCSSPANAYKKTLTPVIALAHDFPVQLQEVMPLLDAFGGSSDGLVRCIRELLAPILASDLAPGTFPVKLAVPVIPTVKLVVACTKFEALEAQAEAPRPGKSPSLRRGCPAVEDPFRVPQNYTRTSTREIKRSILGDKARTFPFSFKWVIHAACHPPPPNEPLATTD